MTGYGQTMNCPVMHEYNQVKENFNFYNIYNGMNKKAAGERQLLSELDQDEGGRTFEDECASALGRRGGTM